MTAELHPDRAAAGAVSRAPALAEVVSGDDIIVLRLDDHDCTPHVLRGTAAAIWNRIDGTRSADVISAELADAYRAPLATVRADVRTCLEELRRAGLITGC